MQPPDSPPTSAEELVQRAESLAGFTLGELAQMAHIRVPNNFKKEKGWSGQLLELWLGAQAGSKPEQDFPELGIELKTIPIDSQGHPLETTYVCYAPLIGIAGIDWQQSNVKNKLSMVLWVPVEGDRNIAPASRRIAMPFLWQPDDEQEQWLRRDWEELMDMIALGEIENITAKVGQYLQLRPKAANGSVLTSAIGAQGQTIQTRPRGFYLKRTFTQALMRTHFQL